MRATNQESYTPAIGKRLAVVVGVNETHSLVLGPLEHAINDAQAIAQVLQEHCGFDLLIPPLTGSEASSAAVKRAVLDLARGHGEQDFLLFYFSGHGQQAYDEHRSTIRHAYLGTADFDEQDVEDDPTYHVSMSWLRDKLFTNTQAGQVFILLDCCYSEDIRTGSNRTLDELRQQLMDYFEIPGAEEEKRRRGLRAALAAAGYDRTAEEDEEHGVMTRLLLQALRGEEPRLLEEDGQLTLSRMLQFVMQAMPETQKPAVSFSNSTGKDPSLACFPEIAMQFFKKARQVPGAERPSTYIPFPRNPLFQPRAGEFEQLEALLSEGRELDKPLHLGLLGVVGMGGIGKTQLAVELAYRCREQGRYPAGIFWMSATGKTFFEWQHAFAALAFNTGYLPPDDDVNHPENEARRARHFCRYLVQHSDALLILDNVEDPNLVISVLPQLTGAEVACTVIYTSRNTEVPHGVKLHTVERLSEEVALRLLLAETRPQLLKEIEVRKPSQEVEAAKQICQRVGYLPLGLVHLRIWLLRGQQVSLLRLLEVLNQRGTLSLMETLFATFQLSWEQVQDEKGHLLFKLACYYPEAMPIPLWLLGLATGLGEGADIFEPLGQACLYLRQVSLLEELSGEQIRLHPLVRAFGLQLIAREKEREKAVLAEAGQRIVERCTDLVWLEERARSLGYRECLEQVFLLASYLQRLGESTHFEMVSHIARWMDRESYLLVNQHWWPGILPELFFQQLTNRSLETGHLLHTNQAPMRWIRQIKPVGTDDQALLRLFLGHSRSVRSVAFSPDGKLLASGSNDHTVRLWEVSNGKQLALLKGHSTGVNSVVFSPDGKQVASSADDGTIRLWEVSSGKQLMSLEGYTGAVLSVAFSPDSRQVASGANDGTIRLWDVSSGKQLALFEGHTSLVRSIAFSPDGKWLASGSWDYTIRLWEVNSGKQLKKLEEQRSDVNCMAFSPDGTQIISSSHDGTIRLWEVNSGKQLALLKGHSTRVNSIAFSPDGKQVVSGADDGTIRLWEVNSGKQLMPVEGHTDRVDCVAFSPDGKQIASGSWDNTVRLWEVGSGKQLALLEGHLFLVSSIAFSPDGKQIASGAADHTIRLWDVSSGKQLALLEGPPTRVNSITFSPDGKRLASGATDKTIRLWDVSSGKQLTQLEGHTGAVHRVAFSPNGCLLFSSGRNGQNFFWLASRTKEDSLQGIYMTTHGIEAIFWQDETHVVLADKDGPRGCPHFYWLELVGM
jgi:WD40 repeat protein